MLVEFRRLSIMSWISLRTFICTFLTKSNNQEMATRTQKDELTTYLLNIDATKVQMRRQQASENEYIVEALLNRLVTAMKQIDTLFDDLYQRKVYAGSYWDGLRVKSATEFDLLMVLRLPFAEPHVDISTPESAPGFLQYKLTRSVADLLSKNNPKWSYQQKLEKFFDHEKLLKKSQVQSWLQGLTTKALDSKHFELPENVIKIEPSQNGPALTYYITTTTGLQIDVDLVPAIDGYYPIPNEIYKSPRFNQLKAAYQNSWFMVPKPYLATSIASSTNRHPGLQPRAPRLWRRRKEGQIFRRPPKSSQPRAPGLIYLAPATGAEKADTFWRIAFTEAEKKLLPTEGCVKTLIKLFKLLRDTQKWNKIASYYIKTLFLLELDASPDPEQWTQDRMGVLFMMMLNKLKTALENKHLSNYFNRKAHLLADMDQSTASNYAHRIERIIKDITVTPENINSYFN